MSNQTSFLADEIYSIKPSFESILSDKCISFEKEAAFAIQAICKSDHALKIALGNRQSVINAVLNIAAIGISLNPAKKQAYLVPRKGEIHLDISYIGLMALAMATGSILWGQAKIVRENDVFELNNLDQLPTHKYDPRKKKERGEIACVYVVVKTHTNDYLTHDMDIDSVYEIRSRSESFKSGKIGPWDTDTEEMIKKTCVKQAYKYWPKTDRLEEAIHFLNTDGGEGIATEITNSRRSPQAIAKAQLIESTPERDQLIADLELVVTEQGIEAYAETFKKMTKEQRQLLGINEHQRLKELGAKHDCA